ncbi:hypothetical protein OC845_006532 [Tilletia horrida]|nr:hypothetical protein OC845_006532 [Tilletia horrida]
MQDADADSFCMGFQDPDNGNENVGALRVQPANENDYNGVTFDPCGSDNFRRRGLTGAAASVVSQSERAVRELRTSIKRRLSWGKGDFVSRGPGSTLQARQDCGAFDCARDHDCEVFGCGDLRCNQNTYRCSLPPFVQPY